MVLVKIKLIFEAYIFQCFDIDLKIILEIDKINSLSQRTKKRTNSKKMNLSGMVGDIDLSSNQMLDFLELFIKEMS